MSAPIASHRAGDRLRSATRPAVFLTLGVLAGAGVGAIARLWMRWVSTDPEFSWSGTIGIIAAFTVFFAAQATTAIIRRQQRQPRAVALSRATSALLSMGLFGAAGAVMLPTVLFGSIAVWRTRASPTLRASCALMATPSIVFVISNIASDFGWTLTTGLKSMTFVAIYAVIILATRPTASPQRDLSTG